MRKRRILEPGAEYHVIARANRGEFILESRKIKDLFLEILCRAKKRYKFQIRNFCIMSSHIHLIIKPGKNENLSKIIQWILSVFAVKYNKIFHIFGHVWYDRFSSFILNTFQKLAQTFIYICENPVKAGIVRKSWEYPYSGIYYLRRKMYFYVEQPDIVTENCLLLLSDC